MTKELIGIILFVVFFFIGEAMDAKDDDFDGTGFNP